MKKIIFLVMIIASLKSFSQSVAINTTGNAANSSAMLDVSANNKGLLIPRMTTTERQNISSPANGLMVFDVTTNTFWYFSTTWKEITIGGGGGGFVLPYIGFGDNTDKLFSVTNTNSSVIGTAIYGKKSTGSGLILGISTGVLGDSKLGAGVVGLSDSGYGMTAASYHNYAILGSAMSPGYAGVYGLANSMNTYGVLGEADNFYTVGVYGKSGDWGKSGLFETTDPSNGDTTVLVKTVGNGPALSIQQNNAFSLGNVFESINKGIGPAVFAQSDKGIAGYFKKINNSNSNEVVSIDNASYNGTGILVNMTHGSGLSPAIKIHHLGQGHGIEIGLTSPANNNNIIYAYNAGTGGGINVNLSNVISNGTGLFVNNEGTGYGVNVNAKKGTAAYFYSAPGNTKTAMNLANYGNATALDIFQGETTNVNPALIAYTKGSGAALRARTDGSGASIVAESDGTGPGLLITNFTSGTVNSLATFQKGGANRARIDGTGKGFFNGGTQNSGADLAEAFDVVGNIQQYEMGDVLVISADKDRTVEKSSGAYSTLVAGVYATKPGVLLTEENIDTDISDKVPMGVVGVIPTKVCLEGGEIKRGDLLVTSSTPGVAMKADPAKVKPGQVIGKALQNFVSNSVGKINVLVNVK